MTKNQDTVYSVTIVGVSCAVCGIVFGLSNDFVRARRGDNRSFYCPNGHSLSYREDEGDVLRKQLAIAQSALDREKARVHSRERELHGARIQLGKVRNELEKTKKRVKNGVCPCCNRSFVNLQRHMAGKHPEFGGGQCGDTETCRAANANSDASGPFEIEMPA